MPARRHSEVWRDAGTAKAVGRELRRLGSRLRQAREARGLTLMQAAEKVHVHHVALSRIETGQGNPTVATLVSLGRALGVELAELFATKKASST